jgi:hypothetical protein
LDLKSEEEDGNDKYDVLWSLLTSTMLSEV